MSLLKGENRIIEIKPGAVWIPIGCLTSNSFSESAEMLNTTTRDNAGWETFVPGNKTYTISFTGVQQESPTDDSLISYDLLKAYLRNGTLLEWRVLDDTAGMVETGTAYIRSIGEQADIGDFTVFDCEMVGVGAPATYVDNTPPSQVLWATSNSVDVQEGYIDLNWRAATDDVAIKQYNIYREDVLYDTVTGSSTLTYRDYSVVDGVQYGYNVSAVDISDNEGMLSVKRLSAPANNPNANYILFEDGTTMQAEDNSLIQA